MDGLTIAGRLADGEPRTLTHDDLFAAPAGARVPDVGVLVPGRSGSGVRFAWIAEQAVPDADARWVTLESADGAFAATLPAGELTRAVVVHADGDRPLGTDEGGPFRLYVPDARDACGNVKHLARVTFDAAPGRDTRPPEDERVC